MLKKRDGKNFYEGNVDLQPLAAGLNRIYKRVSGEGFSQDVALELDGDIKVVADHFGVTPKGAVLLGYITENNVNHGSDEDELAAYMGCSNIEFKGLKKDIAALEERGVVNRGCGRGGRVIFYLSREADRSIDSGEPFSPVPWTGLTVDEVFTRLRIMVSDLKNDVVDSETFLMRASSLMDSNQQLAFCRRTREAVLDAQCSDTEKRLFLYMCHRLVSFGDRRVPVERIVDLSEFMEDEQKLKRWVSNGRLYLQQNGIVTFAGTQCWQDPDFLTLSQGAIKDFLGEVELIKGGEQNARDIVKASSITPRELFYNAPVASQMERLAELLDQRNFAGVQRRLGEMGMRRGFAVLFSGGAGTGKTAGVYELARRSGRDVMAVDMSQLKSKWVGDSEKIVKGVFSRYAELCRSCEKAPILLFNEADAIFAKRMENPQDSVDQMMNAIQNICLDAIENLDGILIATTNLADNFCDEAFSRRFIFKVDFTTPEPRVRAKIWRSMLPDLGEDEALELGRRYAFSGGNIENVARKAAVGYVLSGEKAGFAEVTAYAEEETLASRRKAPRIGF